MKASIIIRTRNEARYLGQVLAMLTKQSEADFEIIIVDSGSTDQTLEIAKSFEDKLDIKSYSITPDQFTYPQACNFGAEKSSSDYLLYLSGHSIPVGSDWLASALADFDNNKVAGVYGPVYPLDNASIWEKMLYFSGFLKVRKKTITKVRMGVLGNTNAVIRKDLWQQYHFDEKNYADGGEDGDWARHFLNLGYKIIFEPKFSVRHSHGLNLIRFIRQYRHWLKLAARFKKNA